MQRFVIVCLAVWRVSSLLVREQGPKNVFRNLREHYGIVYDDDGEVLATPDDGSIGDALSCLWCTSLWVAPLVLVLEKVAPIANNLLAASTGAVLIEDFINGKSNN